VYFPNDCLVSMLTTVDNGRAAEVGLIGSEGMVGVPVANPGVGFIENLVKDQLARFQDGEQFLVILAGQCGKQAIRNRNGHEAPQCAVSLCNSFVGSHSSNFGWSIPDGVESKAPKIDHKSSLLS